MKKIAAIVTGHSKGLGAAIAAELLGRGVVVLGLARSGNPDLQHRYPDALQQVALDLSDADQLDAWLQSPTLYDWLQGAGQVLLVNNAGLLQPVGPLEMQSLSAIATACAVNVAAPLMLAAAVAQATTPAQDRRILHVSSGAGRTPYAGWSLYCASKAALDHHARAVALDATHNLKICSLAPGVIDTDMQTQIRATPAEQFPLRDRFVSLKNDGQLSAPEKCAYKLVDYLLAPSFGQAPVADLRS